MKWYKAFTAWKVSKYRVISGSYFTAFGLNTVKCGPNAGKYGPEITPYLDTFHAVFMSEMEWTPFKRRFWKAIDSIKKFMVSITRSVSLWDRLCN